MAKIKFTLRPSPVLAEHRPLYKIAQALLIVDICGWGKKCSIIKMHLLSWSLKSSVRIDLLRRAVQTQSLSLPVWGFDPALAIALQLSIEDGLLEYEGNSLCLTERGRDFLRVIIEDKDVLQFERLHLESIGKGLTESIVSAAAKGWE